MRKLSCFKLSKNTIVVSWLVSYGLIILLMCILASIAYTWAISYALAEVEHVYQKELDRIAVSMDRSLLEMRRIGLELSSETEVQSLINAGDVTAEQRMEYYSLQKRLSNYSVTNQNITDIGIGFRQLDYVVSNKATYPVDFYADNIGGGSAMWETIGDSSADGFFIIQMANDSSTIGYLLNLPLEVKSPRTAFVHVKLTREALASMLGNSTNRMLSVTIGKTSLVLGDKTLLQEKRENCTQLRALSSFSDVQYELMVNNSELRKNIAMVNLVTTLCVLIGIGLCSLILVFSIRKNYSPVGQLLRTVDMTFDRLPKNYKNEFDFIQQKLMSIQDENEKLEIAVDRMDRFHQEATITQLLLGDISAEKARQTIFLFPDREFYFGVIVVSPVEWRNLFHQEGNSAEENLGLLEYIVNNMMRDFESDNFKVYKVTIGGVFVTLLCAPRDILKSAYSQIEGFPSILSAIFSAEVQIGFSNLSPEAEGIPELYLQAKEAAEFCQIFDKSFQHFRTGCADSLKHAEYAEKVMQANRNFRSALLQRNFSGTAHWIQELMGLTFNQQQSVQDVWASMRALSTIFCGGLAEYKSRCHVDSLDVDSIAENLAGYSTANQLNQAVLSCLDSLKAQEIARNSEERSQLREEFVFYIDKNCTSYELTVSSMAEHFNMTVSALSQKFKKITGMNVLEYITLARIRKSKELLGTRKYTITQVAELVGYNDASTFIRNFKKLENISPGRYLQELDDGDN